MNQDIELTPEWLKLLYEECLAANFNLHQVQADSGSLHYLTPQKHKLWQTLAPVSNFYTSISGVSGQISEEQIQGLLDKQLSTPWHIAQWGPFDLTSPFAQQLKSYLTDNRLPFLIEPAFVNWQLQVNKLPNEYFEQLPSKLKSTLKRKQKKLAKEAEHWEYQLVTTEAQLEAAFKEYESIYHASWKPEEGYIEFIRKFCTVAAQRGWLRFGLLRINQQAIAAQIWFVYNKKVSIFKLAYLPEFKQYSPGTLLTQFLMRHVLEQDEVSLVDFGMGDEPYKADWMNHKNSRYTITSFNSRTISGKLAQLRYQWLPALKRKLTHHD